MRGLHRGLSGSYLGAAESTLLLALHEQAKIILVPRGREVSHDSKRPSGRFADWICYGSAAGSSKLLAGLIAYPHEVRNILYASLSRLRY